MLKIGQKAPAFNLDSSDGGKVSLKSLAGKKVVVYFYPRDNTPGCTREAIAFRDAQKKLQARGAVVLGVSKDTIAAHCKFRDAHGLTFPLLSDPTGEMIEKYGAWGEKVLYGKKFLGIIRSTVVIDENGKVAALFPKVKIDTHVESVLAALDELSA